MGDRGNVVIRGGEYFSAPLVIYTHWGGSKIAENVAEVIGHRARWDDIPYLARRIIARVIGGNDGLEENGTGISIGHSCDNEHNFVVVDMGRKHVGILPGMFRGGNLLDYFQNQPLANFWTFEQIADNPRPFLTLFRGSEGE